MKTNSRWGLWIAGLCTISMLSSCTSPGKRTAVGAGGGAAAGAILGGATGGKKGALIGAGAGAAVGAAVGNYLDKQAKELEKVAETKRTRDGILVNLKNELLFATNKAELKPEAVTQLNQLGDILAKYPEDRIRIGGYTDSTGPDQYNLELSQKRAQKVQEVLIGHGVQQNQMLVQGYGETHPVASNTNEKGRSANRRVELYIDVPQQQTG